MLQSDEGRQHLKRSISAFQMNSISHVSSLLEPTRDLTLDASAITSSLRKTPYTSGTTHTTVPQIKILLNSKHEREVLDGLRRFITIIQSPKRQPDATLVSHLLPTILKNISSPNTHIRKVVYLILVQHAESDQDTALLAINSIQKALSASDPHIRALALRTISSLRVPVIAQIVVLGIKRGVADLSPIVRKTAALAIPKCWKLDPSTAQQLEGFLGLLLGDRQYVVVSAACTALLETGLLDSEDGLDRVVSLLHGTYRALCTKLVDMDDWGQCAALRVLAVYARRCFPRRTKRVKKDTVDAVGTGQQTMQGFYDEPEQAQEITLDSDASETITIQDPDLVLLLKSAQPLLQSRSPAVIVAVTRLYLALEVPTSSSSKQPPPYMSTAIAPLLTLLRPSSTPSITPLALQNILQIVILYPAPFVQHTRRFLLRATECPIDTAPLKLEVLTLLFPHAPSHTQSLILAELATAARRHTSTSPLLLRAAISGIGRCALTVHVNSPSSNRCLSLLLEHVKSSQASADLSETAASEALTQIRHLIQSNSDEHLSTVIRLAKDLDTTSQPKARAAFVWLVGEYAGTDMSNTLSNDSADKGNIAADVLRILAKGFFQEAEEVKLQICILAAKVYVHHLNSHATPTSPARPNADELDSETVRTEPSQSQIPPLYAYIHSLIRYDTSYTLRDVARMHRALLPPPPLSTTSHIPQPSLPSAAANTQLATLLLLAPKPPPVTPSPATSRQGLELGSAALVLGDKNIPGYDAFAFPPWVEAGQEPDPRLRYAGGIASPALPSLSGFGSGSRTGPAAERVESGVGEVRVGAPVVRERNLEDWLGEDEDGSEESGSEEGSTEEETESESEEEEEEESSDEGEAGRLVREDR